MSNYWMETGACLVLFYLLVILLGIISFAMFKGIWLPGLALPPLLLAFAACIELWKTRPSANV